MQCYSALFKCPTYVKVKFLYVINYDTCVSHYRPRPCGFYGTYAHYGLMSGLIGTSIGCIFQDARFFLDKIVEHNRSAFAWSIINTAGDRSEFLDHKMEKFEKKLARRRNKNKQKPPPEPAASTPVVDILPKGMLNYSCM